MCEIGDVFAPARALLDAGYDNGFGVTSLDTLLCEQMSRAERLDFALFLIATLSSQDRGA